MNRKVVSWEESIKHHYALSEIEDKHLPSEIVHKLSKNQKKKLEAKIHNEKLEYLNNNNLTYHLGCFWKHNEQN